MTELLIWNRARLDACRQHADAPELARPLAALKQRAENALRQPPLSVTDDPNLPPSGNPHDYRSYGPYWWPDPDSPDGLPWVRRDGEVNPVSASGNRPAFETLTQAARNLATASYILGDNRYASHAATLLRAWFLAPETRMNPHLEYAQSIPGKCTGRGIGIIDTMHLPELLDSIALLSETGALGPEELEELKLWMEQYCLWCETSSNGRDEQKQKNNHGTWYDVQVAALGLFSGRTQSGCDAVIRLRDRIPKHIEADGSQPHELGRTRSYDYSSMNLRGHLKGARLARQIDIDLTSPESLTGQRLRAAAAFFHPYLGGLENWQWEQIVAPSPGSLASLLAFAADTLDEPHYHQWSQMAFDRDDALTGWLMFE